MILSYDVSKLRAMLKSFYQLSKIRIVVFDDQFEKIAEEPSGDCAFCALVRTDPAALEKCLASDRLGCAECKRTGAFYTYTCHTGLSETVTPIRHGSIVIGYLMFGQVLLREDAEAFWAEVRARCAGYSLDMDALHAAYRKKRPVKPEQVTAAAQLLEACAGYLWLQRSISLKEDSLPGRLDAYITNNLATDLSVGALCARFDASRSKLYKVVREYYGCGVEQLTRALRVDRAKELLKTTGLPVSEVAGQVGYPDCNYFIKVFKKEAGTTPARYRRDG